MEGLSPEMLIIGAGPAGAVAASCLLRDGFRVVLVERERFPRFSIGESLLPHTVDLLEEAGLAETVAAQNFMIKTGAEFYRQDERIVFDFSEQWTAGSRRYTYQVPRADFDKVLADAVERRGAQILYENRVIEACFDGSSAFVVTEDQDGRRREFTPKFVLDASGFGRVLPRLLNLDAPSEFPTRQSIFTHVCGDRRPEGKSGGRIWISVLPKNRAWIWIIPFSDGRTSVGVVAGPDYFPAYGKNAAEQLPAIISQDGTASGRVGGLSPLFEPRTITGYASSVKSLYGPKFALLGNSTEFLDPIFSTGVTLALKSALLSSALAAKEIRGETVNWEEEYSAQLMRGVDTFRTYVRAWYEGTFQDIIFSRKEADPEVRTRICSILGGYVWDLSNPFVAQHDRALRTLASRYIGAPA